MLKQEITNSFIAEVRRLAQAETTTETSYYPAIKRLLEAVLEDRGLKFEVRSGTNEDRPGGGRDQPDIAIYDGNGDYVVVAGEVKTPVPDLTELARSEERNDQIGRYLALTRVVKQVGPSRLYAEWNIRKQLLDDLYIRFFRLAERCIGERAEYGVVSFISNYSFYTGRSHPLMRESLLQAFDSIWIDNLNGDKYKTGKVIPAGLPGQGTSDQSVFSTTSDARGIQVGTGITTMVKKKGHRRPGTATVYFRDFWGKAQDKRDALLRSLEWSDWNCADALTASQTPAGPRPFVEFHPTREKRWKLYPFTVQGGFADWPALDEIFDVSIQGVNPNRGIQGSVVEIKREVLRSRMVDYFSDKSTAQMKELHPVLFTARARYVPATVRARLMELTEFNEERLVPYTIFPLDLRWIYLETEGKLLNEARPELWDNLAENEFLVAVPEPRQYSEIRPLLLRNAFDLHLHNRGSVCFPVTVAQKPESKATLFSEPLDERKRSANLNPAVWTCLRDAWNLSGQLYETDAIETSKGVARLCLAICHSPGYEMEHKESLAQDWAHVPIPREKTVFDELQSAGEAVSRLLDPSINPQGVIKSLLGETAKSLAVVAKISVGTVRSNDLVVTYSFFGNATGGWRERDWIESETAAGELGDKTGDLYINDEVCFKNVPINVWNYALGGYPVIKKWLAYRDSGRRPDTPLSLEEVDHVRSMVHRIAALLVLHTKLNILYEEAYKDPFKPEELALA